MEMIVKLKSEWLPKLCPFGKIDMYVDEDVKSDTESSADEERRYTCRLYTNDYQYRLYAVERIKDNGYLGCTMSTRKPRAGEDWTRGSDLPDGPFTEETWNRIVCAIVANELVPLKKEKITDIKPDTSVRTTLRKQ